jgi:hypothetical protein
VELDTGDMDADELRWAANLADRLAEHWPSEAHQRARRLFAGLADTLTRQWVELECATAAREVAQADTITGRMRLGLVDPSEEIPLGWIDAESPDD